jgi:Co/Zn/Cd efflux system component
VRSHPHDGPHAHDQINHEHDHDQGHHHNHTDEHDHGHSHGLVDESIKRSREGLRAVLLSFAVLGVAAVIQTAVFVMSGSVALLADLIHNFGDALTAVPLGIAFVLRSERAERNRWAVRTRCDLR